MVPPAMSNALDPLLSMSMNMHAQPGVYALLLGSGVSTEAGIPTGWDVVRELVQRYAASPENPEQAASAGDDPEGWWETNGDGNPLGYSNLLEAAAPTPAARRGLLAGFFEPTEEEAESGLKRPGATHRAIARLVKRGTIRVILTTNFDRLIERALEDEGISPQVVSRPEAVAGMTPLVHAAATIIKLHGDYADLGMRNTPTELAEYPAPWNSVLDQVLDQYGLLISGWSAAWDTALVGAIERSPSRRYPLFWDARSSKGEAARRLLALRQGIVIKSQSAEDLFTRLEDRLLALDQLAQPPLTSALAVAQLKRFLPDPVRRIQLFDLVQGAVSRTVELAAESPLTVIDDTTVWQQVQDIHEELLSEAGPTLELLKSGVFHDRNSEYSWLWQRSLVGLLAARTPPKGQFNSSLEAARLYPALLALRVMGAIAVQAGNDAFLLQLFQTLVRSTDRSESTTLAVHALHPLVVLEPRYIGELPRWEGQKWLYPLSHLEREDVRALLEPEMGDDFRRAMDRFEYRLALAQFLLPGGRYKSTAGEYITDDWRWDSSGPLPAELEFREVAEKADDAWPWWPLLGGRDGYDAILLEFREVTRRIAR